MIAETLRRCAARAASFLCAALGCSAAAWAQASAAPPLWEVGGVGFAVSQQAYPGADQQVNRALALPYFIYRGEVLRADQDTAGIRAIKTPQFELDVGVAGSFGSGGSDIEARRGMRALGTLVELGPRLKWNLGTAPGGGRWRADLPLRAVFDLSDGAEHRGWAFEPKLQFEGPAPGGWRYSAAVSAIVSDKPLARTFYGVSASEATALRPAYNAKSGLVAWRLSTSATRSLGPDWRVFGFARVDTVSGAANQASPLVRQRVGGSVGVGLSYTWLRSERRAID